METESREIIENGSRGKETKEDDPLLEGKVVPYPKSVFFIIVTEFCERFSYTGMRTILTMYIRNVLYRGLPNAEDIATVIYHAFVSLCYFTPLLGGIIADSFLGKYKTILYISIIYAIGNCTLSLSALPPLHLPKIPFSLLGLVLIGFGTGGIKPCVNAFAGDQFKLPEQNRQLHQFFFFFYFAINSGSLMSNFVTPIMRRDVSCFGYDTCYSLAFGAPAIFWIVALVIFISGNRYYKIKNPEGNVALQVGGCVWHALFSKKSEVEKTGDHWLDAASDKYSPSFIEDVKVLFRILVLFIPLPIYWALYEQQGSTWTLQATRMKGYISPYLTLKPDQMQALNSFLILFFIPLFERVIYPLLNKCRILTTSLQRMSFGCFMVAFAFVIAGLVELKLEPTYPVLPSSSQSTLHFINALPCQVHVSMKNMAFGGVAKPYSDILHPYTDIKFENIPANRYKISTHVWDMEENCTVEIKPTFSTIEAHGAKAYSTFITTDADNGIKLNFSEDDLEKSREGDAKLKVMYSMTNPNSSLELISTDGAQNLKLTLTTTRDATDMLEVEPRMYEIFLNEGNRRKRFQDVLLDEGGNYVLAIFPQQTGLIVDLDFSVALKSFVLTQPNSVHMLYLLPQYTILTLAEMCFSITGFTFSYTQAPVSMKAVIQSLWLLTIGLGSFLVIIITSLNLFDRPAIQFFSYSVIMIFGTVIFIILAYRYKPNDTQNAPLSKSEEERRKDSVEFVMEAEDIPGLAVDLVK